MKATKILAAAAIALGAFGFAACSSQPAEQEETVTEDLNEVTNEDGKSVAEGDEETEITNENGGADADNGEPETTDETPAENAD